MILFEYSIKNATISTIYQGYIGIALTNYAVYASSGGGLVKSTNKCIRTIHIQHCICGIDIDKSANIYE